MHKARWILPVLLLIAPAAAAAQQAVHWDPSLGTARQTAAQSRRFVLLFFSAPWCQACHRLENSLQSQSGAVTALEANFVPVKINGDAFPNLVQQYGVTCFPTTVILSPGSGEVLAVLPEAMPVDVYLSKLTQAAADARRRNAALYAQIPAQPAIGAAAAPDAARASSAPVASQQDRLSPAQTSSATARSGGAAGEQPPGTGQATPPSHAAHAVALDGYCPVQLVENNRWQKGDRTWGVIHRGRVYLFTGEEERGRFKANPDRYAPVNSGNDVVLSLEVGRTVAGYREHGARFDGHVYLFASEATLEKFRTNPHLYADRALDAIRPAARETASR